MAEAAGAEGLSRDREIVDTLRLEVHPSVVFKLGADLVTDDVQALIELVKNSYDADATRVRVVVDTNVWTDPLTGDDIMPELVQRSDEDGDVADDSPKESGPEVNALQGRIVITDNGTGMDLETIRQGWLTVSLSHKQAMKAQGQTTEKDRTPLGDKGLGRLGAQRLGDVITLTTRLRDDDPRSSGSAEPSALRVTIRWSQFATVDKLSAIPIEVEKISAENVKQGTTLEIRGLSDIDFWRQGETEKLQRDLATMISPYDGVSGFSLSFKIDEQPINLREKAQAILDAAPVTYVLSYAQKELGIEGRFTVEFLRPPQGRDDIAMYDELIGRDNGFAFMEWLFDKKQKGVQASGLMAGDDKHFIRSLKTVALGDLPNVEIQNGIPADPGPFNGEVSGVPLNRDATSVFDRTAEYRDFVRAVVGIKVYRDGFGVRVDDDWLGLGSKWTSGTSFYSLRPGNVIGYVNISARDNAALEETTNREAFRTTPAYRNFFQLLSYWADYTEQAQASLRRGYNDYKKEKLSQVSGAEPTASPQQLVQRATSQVDSAKRLVERTANVREALREIQGASVRLGIEKEKAESAIFNDPELVAAVERMIAQVDTSVGEADALIHNLDELSLEQNRLRASLDLLADQVSVTQSQISDAWESVALGLSAEALAHEVQHISDGLRGRSAQITQYLKSVESTDQRVWTFVEHVRSSASALTKQTSRLTPSLRFVRERKSTIDLSKFSESLRAYYTERWGSNGLRIELAVINDFGVHMNEGKLTQIFDNLILNSEYWLLQQLRSKQLNEGVIKLEIDSPFVTLSDNGPGLDAAVENSLFEPFVTLKPSQQGRGLGLFVVQQILDAERSTITLTPERNRYGHRYEFRINFSQITAAIDDSNTAVAVSVSGNAE